MIIIIKNLRGQAGVSGQNVTAKVKFKSETEAVPKLTKSTVSETAKKHSLAPAQVKSLKSYYSE